MEAYVKKFNLTTNDIVEYDGNTWIYINGKKIRRFVADAFPDLLGFNITRKERGKSSSQLLTEAMKGVCFPFRGVLFHNPEGWGLHLKLILFVLGPVSIGCSLVACALVSL